MMSASRFKDGNTNGSGLSWFTLWTANTAVDLWSSGGNRTPFTFSTATDLAVVSSVDPEGCGSQWQSLLREVLATVRHRLAKATTAQPCCSLPASTVSCNSWPATPSLRWRHVGQSLRCRIDCLGDAVATSLCRYRRWFHHKGQQSQPMATLLALMRTYCLCLPSTPAALPANGPSMSILLASMRLKVTCWQSPLDGR